jgi:hypothetical protein
MPNRWHGLGSPRIAAPWGKNKVPNPVEGKVPTAPEKTVAWPGLPGKKGPNRAAGTHRVKTGMKNNY